jgi:ubiquitin C-terminal hydrolase
MITEIQEIQSDTDDSFVSGIKNIGNTCYLNSCFQLLLYTYELLDVFRINESKQQKQIPETIVLLEWNEIKNILLHKKCTVTPLKCIAGIHHVAKLKDSMMFNQGEQNDICEFLMFMLDCFHLSLKSEIKMEYDDYLRYMKIQHSVISEKCFQLICNQCLSDYSEILNLFYGIQLNVIQAKDELRIVSVTPSIFSIIPLDIPNNILQPTLHDCLDLYCQGELLENDNAYYDDNEKTYISALKSVIFWRLPHILIFTFNRLKTNKRGKNNTLIHFPIQSLDLYCQGELLENDNAYYDDNEKTYISALKSVIFWRLPHILIFTFNRLKTNKRGKNNTLIHFPIQSLDMTKYIYEHDPKNPIQIKYELYGIGCHFGTISMGHYTCYVKNKNNWYFCNDDTIKQVNNPIQLINPNVYCLFYRKINFS